jgi:spore coat protein U-like protein
MNTSRKLLLIAASAIAVSAVASSALAQATSSASATAAVTVVTPINIASTGALDFGRVVLDGTANDATLVMTTGSTTVTPTHATVVAGGSAAYPTFTLKGQPGQLYDMTVTPSLTIASLNRLAVSGGYGTGATNLTTAGATVPFVYTLTVPQGTAAGTYNGTVTVSVTYE